MGVFGGKNWWLNKNRNVSFFYTLIIISLFCQCFVANFIHVLECGIG